MDLHAHTCLSPCADNSMVPRTIVERAKQAGLDAVGICDHNAAANVQAVREVGREAGIGVLAGLEVTTAEKIHRLGGLAIASHVDRQIFSILSQLGFFPAELDLDGVELSRHSGAEEHYELRSLPVVRSSDAHFPEEIGGAFTTFFVEEATVAEIGMALAVRDGRRIVEVRARDS